MKKVENVLWQAVDWVLYLSMIIMVIVTFANVIGRYVFNHSIAAADEIARMAFVWLTYIGSIVAMKEGTHIRVDIVVSLVPPAVRKVFDIISNLLVDGIMILTIRVTMNLVMENLTYPMPLTKIPYGVVQAIIPLSMERKRHDSGSLSDFNFYIPGFGNPCRVLYPADGADHGGSLGRNLV